MRTLFTLFTLGGAALLLAACGSREPLRPAPGQTPPPVSKMTARAPTTQELLAQPPIARPERQDEVLSRSQERKDDPFDLPPTR
jgi:hypothetical protein